MLFTQALERKGVILCCFLAPHVGVKPQDASARLRFCMATDLFFRWSLGVPYSNRVAVRLLYKGNDEKTSSRL